jgi:Protein of unknown function (DUF3499)
MSTPICSRCQKIYTAGSAPAKCVNCGGDVRVPEAASKPATTSTPKTTSSGQSVGTSPLSGKVVNRPCSRSGCQWPAMHSIKYYYEGKKIVMAPAPTIKDKDAQDLCPNHAKGFEAPNTWTLVHAQTLPSLLDGPGGSGRTNSSYSQSSTAGSSGDGCFTFIAGLIGFVLIVVIGAAVVIFLMDFFSGMDTSNTKPIRLPFRWRK